jgi:hypothetical protein
MTRNEFLELAISAKLVEPGVDWSDHLVRDDIDRLWLLANLINVAARRDERESCALIAESYEPRCDTCPSGVSNAIRARGNAYR